MSEDVQEEELALSADECNSRLAAAEFDMLKIVNHSVTGHHPNLNET